MTPDRPLIQRRHLPSCGPLSSSRNKNKRNVVISTQRFTRDELEDACRRNKTKEIAALAADRKRNAILQQRAVQRGADRPIDTSSQLRSLDVGVKLCARKYNEAKSQACKLEDEVRARRDQLNELEGESKALHEMLEGNNVDARKITHLTSKIQGVNEASEDILAYRQRLNFMHQRLGKNSVLLDSHIGDMSSTVADAQKEKSRSASMLSELESGLTFASIELDETIQDTRVVDKERNQELTMKRAEANNASRLEEWNRERVTSNLAMHVSLTDAYSERERLQRTMHERRSQFKELRRSMDEAVAKLASFEESFGHIKNATGVNGLTEMVHKINNHEYNHHQLMKEKKDAEERLKAAKSSFLKDQEALSLLKTNGLETTDLSREILDDIKDSIKSEQTDGKIVKSTNKRLENLLVGLRQGGIGLYNRLLPFHCTFLTGDAPKLGEMDSTNAIQAASDTLEMVGFVEKILSKMILDIPGGIQNVDSNYRSSKGREEGSVGSIRPESPSINCRITPKVCSLTPYCLSFQHLYRRLLLFSYPTVLQKPEHVDNMTAQVDDSSTVSSVDDIVSRTKLKTSSEMHISHKTTKDSKTRKKRVVKPKQGPLSPAQAQGESTKQTAPPPAGPSPHPATFAENNVVALPLPVTSQKTKHSSSRDDPMDRVTTFLTEMPLLE